MKPQMNADKHGLNHILEKIKNLCVFVFICG